MIIHALRYGPEAKLTSVTLGYSPATNSWRRAAHGPVPSTVQTTDVVMWTGSEMLVCRADQRCLQPCHQRRCPMAREPSGHDGAAAVMDRLGEITVPTLVMAGSDDFVFPPGCQQELAAGLPNARLQIIDRAGHSPHSEQTAEVMAAVKHFLSADTPAA